MLLSGRQNFDRPKSISFKSWPYDGKLCQRRNEQFVPSWTVAHCGRPTRKLHLQQLPGYQFLLQWRAMKTKNACCPWCILSSNSQTDARADPRSRSTVSIIYTAIRNSRVQKSRLYAISYHTIPYHTIPYHTILYYTLLD